MKELLKLERIFQATKWITYISLLAMGLVSATALISSYRISNTFSNRIYIENQNSKFSAFANDNLDNREAEIKFHVSRFHKLMFNLSPESGAIKSSLNEAYGLADESAKIFSENLQESGYYNKMIQGNVVQRIKIDSVSIYPLTNSRYPYEVYTTATVEQNRSTASSIKVINTHCFLENMKRTDNSPNGLFIRDFLITKTEIIQ
jgi:conjugative transposon TraK protein